MDIQTLECDKIEFHGADEASRSFRKEVAEGLAMSIEAEGMYYPIAVRVDPDKPGYYRGVQGRHRLHAQHRILGRPTIACNVLTMDDDEAAMAAVAENTFRKELSQAERSKALRLWHRMFAAKHPERVGRGKAGRAAIQARKGVGKAKTRGRDRANDQKAKLNRATAGGKAVAGDVDQRANLIFKTVGLGADGDGGTSGNLKAETNGHGDAGETDGKGHPANFAQTVAAATGCSETTVKRELRVALNLTDEQLEVCEKWKLNKGEVDSIAAIKDEAKRAEVIGLIGTGLEFDDAWAQADPDARKATGKSRVRETAEAAAEEEMLSELTDDDWFDRFCGEKAALLGNPVRFKADALVFRRIARPCHLFRTEVEGALNDTKAAEGAGPYYDLVRRFVSAGHPKDWPLCGECGGSGVHGDRGSAGCTTCCGAGYLVESPPGRPTTVAGGDREDRTVDSLNETVSDVLDFDTPPDGDRARDGKPYQSDTPDPISADFEAEQAAMFDWPED